ncbi:MAG: carbamoyltransferase C-terminal domain-containing protein [Thermoleophilia bacterium]
MIVLGVTDPWGEDNAAALLVDGALVAMVEEERLNRIKHAPNMAPEKAVRWCLEQAGLTLRDVDVIAIGFSHPRAVLEGAVKEVGRRRLRGLDVARGPRREYTAYRLHKFYASQLGEALGVDVLGGGGNGGPRVAWVRHHVAHAASAYLFAPFDRSNVMSLDGHGGQDAGLIGSTDGVRLDVSAYVEREWSWGIFYERYTAALGFRPHNDEGKVMGLAAYGDHGGEIFPFIDLDGRDGVPTYDRDALYRHLGTIRRRSREESPINGYHEHVAARLQYSLEQVLQRITENLHAQTGIRDFTLAGGTALNCSANGKLCLLPHVDRLFVQPAAGDCGTALGAAAYVYSQTTGKRPSTTFDHAYWGPSYTNDQIQAALDGAKLAYRRVDDVAAEAAKLLADDRIVGWFQGRMEVGPRALGGRSILANPTNAGMKDAVNKHVKFREPWRPFAPSLLGEAMREYFGTDHPSPFMILAFEAQPAVRDRIPAALHVDDSGRPQTVSRETNEPYWRVIDEFRKVTGVPVVLNTSFNVDSEPIVCNPRNAIATYAMSGMDALAIGDFLLEKPRAGGSG